MWAHPYICWQKIAPRATKCARKGEFQKACLSIINFINFQLLGHVSPRPTASGKHQCPRKQQWTGETKQRISIPAQRSLRCSPQNAKGFFTLNAGRNKIQVFTQMCALIQNFSLTFQKFCSFSQKPRSIQFRTQMIVLLGKTKTNTLFVFPTCFIVEKSVRERKPSSLNVFPMLINRSDRSLMGKGGTPAQRASPTGISTPFQKFWLPTDKTGPSTKNKAQSVTGACEIPSSS